MSEAYMELPPSRGLRFLPYYAFGNVSELIGDKSSEKYALGATKDSSISSGIPMNHSFYHNHVRTINFHNHIIIIGLLLY